MGSGFRTFQASEVLTSSNVQNYLMDQAVTVHSGTAVLATAIPSPEAGMVAYVDSGDSSEGLYTYNGSAWRKGPGWNAPWGFISYTEVTTNQSANNATILTATISVVANRRYQFNAQIPGYFSNTANNNAQVLLRVAGSNIAELRMWTSRITSADIGGSINGYYAATVTNASLSVDLYSAAVIGTNHQYLAAAGKPISLLVQDIGPSGAPV